MPNLRTQLYAQTRAFEFAKFGLDIPTNVCQECGPITKSSLETFSTKTESTSNHPKEVVECVNELAYRVSLQDTLPQLMRVNQSLPPLMSAEYDVAVPVTSKGLMMNVGELNGSVAFLGYRRFPDGRKGPAESKKIIRNEGDKIIAVDGVSTANKSFKEVISLLRDSGKNTFAIMRFVSSRFPGEIDTSSAGNQGRYAIEELKKKFSADRKRLLVRRGLEIVEKEAEQREDEDESVAPPDSDAEDSNSEGSFQPDSDEEPLDNPNENYDVAKDNAPEESSPKKTPQNTDETETKQPESESKENTEEEDSPAVKPESSDAIDIETDKAEPIDAMPHALTLRPESTKSLAFRLLNAEVGYSSDEGGDDDWAYYIDGVDDTFTSRAELPDDLSSEKLSKPKEEPTVPVRRNEFSNLGDRSKLVASVAIISHPPDSEDFDENFPFPSKKAIAAKEAAAQEAANLALVAFSPEKQFKRSTVKVEQLSVETGEVLNVWANVESAAATLQLPLKDLKRLLMGDLDDDFSDEVGGFRWQYAAVGAVVTAGESKRSKKGKEAWLEFRDRLYDPNEPHIYKNNNRLRDYQVEGVNWLASTFYRKQGCILADEMVCLI
jgi:hypothetical protein